MEGICGFCYQPGQLFHVPGYETLGCSTCSDQFDKKPMDQIGASFRNSIPPVVPESCPSQPQPGKKQKSVKDKEPIGFAEIENAIHALENEYIDRSALFLCPFCSRSFAIKETLINHIRHHGAERKFICGYCNKGFTQAANLRNHERIHRNERPYTCTDCGKAFTQITNLNNHRRLHTGERPFVCIEKDCGRSFAQVTNLNNHMKTHHKVQQYVCIHCPARFGQNSQLNVHMATHAGFDGLRCPHCPNKEFKQQGQLQHHLRQHGVDFPFSCNLCEEKFLQSVHLERHMENHMTNPKGSGGTNNASKKQTRPQATKKSLDNGHAKRPRKTAPEEEISQGFHECYFEGCGTAFRVEEKLYEHLKLVHSFDIDDEADNLEVQEEDSEDPVKPSHTVFIPERGQPVPSASSGPSTSRARGRPKKATTVTQSSVPDVGHFMEITSDADTYLCSSCSRTFKTEYSLLKHEQKFHAVNRLLGY